MSRILLADDHPMIRTALEVLLRDTSFDIVGMAGTGGEASVSGTGHPVDDAAVRATVAAAAGYDPADRYVLFELRPAEVRCKGYGDVALPECRRWYADA